MTDFTNKHTESEAIELKSKEDVDEIDGRTLKEYGKISWFFLIICGTLISNIREMKYLRNCVFKVTNWSG